LFFNPKEKMMKKNVLSFLAALLFATPVMAQTVNIEITNLSNGIYFTPLLVASHPDTTHLFQGGTAASANLQAMAEGGDTSGLIADLQAVSADIVDNPAEGLLAPGMSATAIVMKGGQNTHLSLVAMLLPTNDGFVGLDALEIPNEQGTYIYFLNAYDAGTEVNNEVINGGGAPGTLGIPADPGNNSGTGGTGVTSTENNLKVHIHRGIIGDFDLIGGKSDLARNVHRWLNPIAKLVIIVQ